MLKVYFTWIFKHRDIKSLINCQISIISNVTGFGHLGSESVSDSQRIRGIGESVRIREDSVNFWEDSFSILGFVSAIEGFVSDFRIRFRVEGFDSKFRIRFRGWRIRFRNFGISFVIGFVYGLEGFCFEILMSIHNVYYSVPTNRTLVYAI